MRTQQLMLVNLDIITDCEMFVDTFAMPLLQYKHKHQDTLF